MKDKININLFNGGFLSMLAILFIALKLLDKIDWSWIWVLSPLWIPLGILLIGFLIIIIMAAIQGMLE